MSLRFVHTADLHLGARFAGLGDRGENLRSRLLQAFDNVVNLAITSKADLLLIAGDLFDSTTPSSGLFGQVVYRFQDLSAAGVAVLVSPGTHDLAGPGSIYLAGELEQIPGLYVFRSEELVPVHFEQLDCVVYGNANVAPFRNRRPLSGFQADTALRWKLCVMHAGFDSGVTDDEYLVGPGEIASSGLDYLALGHYHSFSDRSSGGTAAFYPGSPEIVRIQPADCGDALLVELGSGTPTVTRKRTGTLEFRELSLDAGETTGGGLLAALQGGGDPDIILRLVIEGIRPLDFPDVEEVITSLKGLYFHLRIDDRSLPASEAIDPDAWPAGSPTSLYLGLLSDRLEDATPEEKGEIEEAMALGVALLNGEGSL